MDFHLPELGEGVYEAEVVRWLVKPGDVVKRAQVLLEVLTDKATMEVSASFAGTIDSLRAEPGQQAKVGDVVLTYSETAGASVPSEPAKAAPTAATLPASSKMSRASNGPITTEREDVKRSSATVKAAPSVRQMAHKLGIDLSQIAGSGPNGRILADDLTSQIQRASAAAVSGAVMDGLGSPSHKKGPSADFGKPGTRVKLQGLRRKIAEHMVLAKRTIPHYTYVDECDVTELVKMRDSLKEDLAGKGVKLTYIPFFVKAVVGALKDVPIVNSSLDDAAGEIVLHDQYNIGLAVATPGGLIVPVIQNADQLDLVEIARQAERLGNDARNGRNRLEDLRGGTFTITSIGSLGGLFATPIIDHPQVAILGIGKIVKRPVFDEHDQVRPAHIVYLSLTCDHRVLDGAVATAFGNAIIRRLQNPAGLLLDL